MKRLNLSPAAVVFLAGALLVGPALQAATETTTQTYSLNADGRVNIENVNGGIKVLAWDGEDVKVDAVKEGRNEEIVAGIKIDIDASSDRLSIKTELPKVKHGWFRGTSTEGSVKYTLHVPSTVRLEKVASVNGDIAVEGVKGDVRASTVNGSIRCRDLGAAADISTVNGGIRTTHERFGSGDRIKIRSVNGGIEVGLPVDLSADVDASTVNGAIRSEFEFAVSHKQSRHSVKGRIGDGAGSLELSTVNGGIRIRKAWNEQAAAR